MGKNKVSWLKWVSFGLILVYGMAMFYRLGTVPSLYVDESNYANEVISLVKFGTDIHGFYHPVYFGSVWGARPKRFVCNVSYIYSKTVRI